jgi:hypothetical protein
MGNKGCESEEAIKRGRILKKSVFSQGITSSKIKVGDNIEIDVEAIINGKYLTELQDSEYFVSTNRNPGVQSLSDDADLLARRNSMSFGSLAVNESGECTKDLPEAVIQGQATEFELGNEFGIGIGFGPGGALGGILEGLDFNLKKMSMGLNINAFQPKTGTALASAYKKGTKTDFGGGVKLNLGIISINPSAMLRQPVADVISSTLRGALVNIGKRLEEQEPWSARVYKDNDSHIMINAGSRHGLKKGDTLYISNMQYEWSAKPCESDLIYQINRQDRDNPIAKVIIETAPSADMTIARVFEQRGVDIQEGARAYIYYLKGSKDQDDPLPNAPNPEEVFK